MAQTQTPTDELAVKYGSDSNAPAKAAPGTDELAEKYGGKQYAATTADNEVERNAPPPYYGFTPGNVWKNLKQVGSGAVEMGKDVLFPQGKTEGERLSYLGNKYIFDPADQQKYKSEEAYKQGHTSEGIGHGVAAALPVIGPWVANLSEQAGRGDIGGAATQAGAAYLGGKALETIADVSTTAGAKSLPKIGEFAGRTVGGENPVTVGRTMVGDMVHDPATGKLKPAVQGASYATAAIPGAKLGHMIAGTEGGIIGGGMTAPFGPTAVEKVFPESPRRLAGRLPQPAAPATSNSAPTPQPAAGLPAPTLAAPTPTETGLPQPAEAKPTKPMTTAQAADKLSKMLTGTTEPEKAPDPLAEKYPDKAIRQMVHANGEEIVNKIGGDKATMKAIHDLKNADIGVAASKLGYDMGQRSVTSSGFEGGKGVTRQQVLDDLIKAGHTPQEIVAAAKKPVSEWKPLK